MKIVFVTPSMQGGGAERVVSILSNNLLEKGFEVGIVVVSFETSKYELNPNIQTKWLRSDLARNLPPLQRIKTRRKKIKEAVLSLNPDVVISFTSTTNIDTCIALKRTKVKLIVSERNDPQRDPSSKIKRVIRRFVYKRANGFVFQTQFAQEYFSKKIRNRSTVIFNPISDKLMEPYFGDREKRVVAVGRLFPQKNYGLLLRAFGKFYNHHPEYSLEIFGIGEQENNIKNTIRDLGLEKSVILRGYAVNVHEQIKNAAFFVMTSDYEGMPNALLEAMAIGLPCISTDCPCGGPRTLIKNSVNGLLVPVGEENLLLEKMMLLAEDEAFARKLGENASKIRETAKIQIVVNKWVDFINNVK